MGFRQCTLACNLPIRTYLLALHVRTSLPVRLPKEGNKGHLVGGVLRLVIRKSGRDQEDDRNDRRGPS